MTKGEKGNFRSECHALFPGVFACLIYAFTILSFRLASGEAVAQRRRSVSLAQRVHHLAVCHNQRRMRKGHV